MLAVVRSLLAAVQCAGGDHSQWYLLQVAAVDTNGAGDTFATSYMLALAAGERNPGQTASWAASRAVQQPQKCKPQCVTQAIQHELWPAR